MEDRIDAFLDGEVAVSEPQTTDRIDQFLDAPEPDAIDAFLDADVEVETPDSEGAASQYLKLVPAGIARAAGEAVAGLGRIAKAVPIISPLQSVADPILERMGQPTIADTATEFGRSVADRAMSDYGIKPETRETLAGKAIEGAASVVPILAAPPAAIATGAAMAGESSREEAAQAGADETTQAKAFIWNAITGAVTERLLGVPALFKSAKGAVSPVLKSIGREISEQAAKGFVREGAQETLQQFAQDAIAKYAAAYDPERNLLDLKKLATTFALGGAVGAPLGGVVQLAASADARRDNQEATSQPESEVEEEVVSESAPPSEVIAPIEEPLAPSPTEAPQPPVSAAQAQTARVQEAASLEAEADRITKQAMREGNTEKRQAMMEEARTLYQQADALASTPEAVAPPTLTVDAEAGVVRTPEGAYRPDETGGLKAVTPESTEGKSLTVLLGEDALRPETAPEAAAPVVERVAETVTETPKAEVVETEVTETPAEPPIPPETPPVATSAAPLESPTGIRNAIVDRNREAQGLPPRMAPLRQQFGQWWDAAMARLDQNQNSGTELVESLSRNPRALTPEENAILAHETVIRENAYNDAVDALNKSPGDPELVRRVEDAAKLNEKLYDAGQASGTFAGRQLASRRFVVNRDLTLGRMLAETRAVANQGRPLTEQQSETVRQQFDEIQTLKKKLAEQETKAVDAELGQYFDKLLSDTRKQAKQSASSGTGFLDFLRSQSENAQARIDARRGKMFADPFGIQVAANLVDYGIITARYIAEGAAKIGAFTKRLVTDFGDDIKPHANEIFEAAKKQHEGLSNLYAQESKPQTIIAKANEAQALDRKTVFDLARAQVQSGVGKQGGEAGMREVFTSVTNLLKQKFPDVTERQVRDLFTDYGKVTYPSKAEDATRLREFRRIGQLVSAIEDAQRKVAPKRTGMQRDEPTQAIREKMKELQAAMRDAGIETTSPEQQLKSTNAARETALRNQIEDLDKRLQGFPPIKKGAPVEATETVERLRAERDAMRAELKRIEGENKKSPEEIALQRYKTTIRKKTQELERKIKSGDYTKPSRKITERDDEAIRARYAYDKAVERFNEGLLKAKLANESVPKKLGRAALETANTARALMTSLDLSAVLRQGGFIALGHPIRAAKSIVPMLRAFASPQAEFKVAQEIASRPNAPLYKQSGLYLAEKGTTLSKLEEAYMSRWIEPSSMVAGQPVRNVARKVKNVLTFPVAGSQRAYTTFLNKLRADSFDAMAEGLSRNGKVTPDEAKAIANYVNVATGRGNAGSNNAWLTSLNTVFFAPRYVASRFQLLAGQPLYRGSARTRNLVSKEYARFLTGVAVVYGLAQLAGVEVEKDPRSSDFGKMKFGDTRLDPLAGLQQVSVFLTRTGTGETKGRRGVAALRDTSRPLNLLRSPTDPLTTATVRPGGANYPKTLGNFVRSKLSPLFGGAVDVATGEDIQGNPVTPTSAVARLFTPLSIGDIADAMKEQGVPKGTALSMLALFGMGLKTYDRDPVKEHAADRKYAIAEFNKSLPPNLPERIKRGRRDTFLREWEARNPVVK